MPRKSESAAPRPRARATQPAQSRRKKPAADQAPPDAAQVISAAVSSSLPVTRVGEPTRDEIRLRAYEIYQRRGGHGGSEQEDWLQAERELRGPRSHAS